MQITEQQHTTVRQIGKMNKWYMALHQLLCNIFILIQASNPAPIIMLLNAFTHDVDHFAAALYNIDGHLTTLADNLHGLETAINGGYDHIQEIWLQELQALITRVKHTVVECMLLAEDRLPDHDDLVIICNLPSTLRQITSLTECTASEDLGYNILHHVNSLANNLIGPTIPCTTSAPAPGLTVLLLHVEQQSQQLCRFISEGTLTWLLFIVYWSWGSTVDVSQRIDCRTIEAS